MISVDKAKGQKKTDLAWQFGFAACSLLICGALERAYKKKRVNWGKDSELGEGHLKGCEGRAV
jgi:hypothetical protein